MKKRVIFVGMNNKSGLPPLCSTTRSGKLIDKVIKALGDEFNCLKSNLYDLDHWPDYDHAPTLYQWAQRVEFTTDDIVVTLGDAVKERFKSWPHKFVSVGHPSMRGGIPGTHAEYIDRAKNRIINF